MKRERERERERKRGTGWVWKWAGSVGAALRAFCMHDGTMHVSVTHGRLNQWAHWARR